MRSNIKNKIDYYLEKISDLGWEFDCIKPFSTAGDIRPPYPYQWQATTKIREGEDDANEGLGGNPLEAMKELYKSLPKGAVHMKGGL